MIDESASSERTKCSALGGGHGGAKDLIDRVQIHRHAEYGIVDRGLYLVVITSHVTETVDVLPDPFVVGMEDVWSVSMDQHIGFMAFGEAVATNVAGECRRP